jgi:hypothetical protein
MKRTATNKTTLNVVKLYEGAGGKKNLVPIPRTEWLDADGKQMVDAYGMPILVKE